MISSITTIKDFCENLTDFLPPGILGWPAITTVRIDADTENNRIIIEKITPQCDICGKAGANTYFVNKSSLCVDCIDKNIDRLMTYTKLKQKIRPVKTEAGG